jgi:phage terminase small subunit
MAKRPGPRPKPSPLRALEGRTAPSHGYRADEKAAEPGPFTTPDYLGVEGAAFFDQFAPELERAGLLRPRYVPAYALTAVAPYVYAERCWRLLRDSPPLIKGRGDALVANPLGREFRTTVKLMLAGFAEFGMTPAAVTDLARRADEYRHDDPAAARLLS